MQPAVQKIHRHFAQKPNTYSAVKPADQKSRQNMLLAGIKTYKTVAEVVENIRSNPHNDALFLSKNSYFGPKIPKSAQKLLAFTFISENPHKAFLPNGRFNLEAFKKTLLDSGYPDIIGELKDSYFSSITQDSDGTVNLAAKDSVYFVTMSAEELVDLKYGSDKSISDKFHPLGKRNAGGDSVHTQFSGVLAQLAFLGFSLAKSDYGCYVLNLPKEGEVVVKPKGVGSLDHYDIQFKGITIGELFEKSSFYDQWLGASFERQAISALIEETIQSRLAE